MAGAKPGRTSSYLEYLPAVYREDGATEAFLGRFLLAFEHVLTGLQDSAEPGLEEILEGTTDLERGVTLAGLERYCDTGRRGQQAFLPPEQRAPAEFLEWLAGWVAVVPRADLSEERLRELISRAMDLYRLRGTKEGILRLLDIFGLGVTIDEPSGLFQVEVSSRVEVDTVLDGAPPHYFHVTARIPSTSVAEVERQEKLARALLDAEKPAHTHYDFLPISDVRFELDEDLELGVNTVIGE